MGEAMHEVLRKKEPTLLAAFVWAGWALFVLVVLMIVVDIMLVYGDDVHARIHNYFEGPPIPGIKAIPSPPPPKPGL